MFPDSEDEAAVVARARMGDADAFDELVRRYEAKVRRYCGSILGDQALADDVAQEVFLRAYRALARFRGDCQFVHWLFRIATNQCRNQLRYRILRPTSSYDELLEHNRNNVEALLSLPADVAMPHEHAETVRLLLQALSPQQREILLLREVEGLSYQEIAEVLKCSLDSVKARLRRVREKLDGLLRHFS